MPITDVQLERSWLDEFRARLNPKPDTAGDAAAAADFTPGIAIDEPGLYHRTKARDRWVEPRLTSRIAAVETLRGQPEDVVLTIKCFAKVESKGKRRLVLSEIADEVRKVMDPRFGARSIIIKDDKGRNIGLLECDPLTETRAYNQTAIIRGDSIPGLDVATLSVSCSLSQVICP